MADEDYSWLSGPSRYIRAARDWWNSPSINPPLPGSMPGSTPRPSLNEGLDVNLPIDPNDPRIQGYRGKAYQPKPEPLFKKLTKNTFGSSTPDIGPQVTIGGEPLQNKTGWQRTGELAAGTIGSLSESAGRAGGAMMDVADPRNTGSESKPISDVVWEGLKGVKSGWDKPFMEATDPGQEFFKRQPLPNADPISKEVAKLGLSAVDITMLGGPEKLLALLGAKGLGAAKVLGMGAHALEGTKEAWMPAHMFENLMNIKGYTHRANTASDIPSMLRTGFKSPRTSDDVLDRWMHASGYSPEEAARSAAAGKVPKGTHPGYQGGPQMPVALQPDAPVLNLQYPVPMEDIKPIIDSLHPTKDKALRDEIMTLFHAQSQYVVPHEAVRSGHIPLDVYKAATENFMQDRTAREAVSKLRDVLTRQKDIVGARGIDAEFGGSALSHPSMATPWGGIWHRDWNASNDPWAMAVNPKMALAGPEGSHATGVENVPWESLGTHADRPNFPYDAPVGSPTPARTVPTSPVQTPQQQAQAWATQNTPAGPNTGYTIQSNPSGTSFDQSWADPNKSLPDLAKEFQQLDPASQQAWQQSNPSDYDYLTKSHGWQDALAATSGGTGQNMPSVPPSQAHMPDLKDVFEGYGVDPTFLNNAHPDWTPEQLHQQTASYLHAVNQPEAANEVEDLWNLKKTGVPDTSPAAPSKSTQMVPSALQDFIEDVEPPTPSGWGNIDTSVKIEPKMTPQTWTADTPAMSKVINSLDAGDDAEMLVKHWSAMSDAENATFQQKYPDEAMQIDDLIFEWQQAGGAEAQIDDWNQVGKLRPVEPPTQIYGTGTSINEPYAKPQGLTASGVKIAPQVSEKQKFIDEMT
jgi:hypothetical protein